MHAVIKTGGKQYRVQAGDVIKVEKLAGVEAGDSYTFEHVLAAGAGDDFKIGTPMLSGAKVTASIVEQARAKKIIVFKKNRRQGYKKRNGHRQHFTRIKIESIEA